MSPYELCPPVPSHSGLNDEVKGKSAQVDTSSLLLLPQHAVYTVASTLLWLSTSAAQAFFYLNTGRLSVSICLMSTGCKPLLQVSEWLSMIHSQFKIICSRRLLLTPIGQSGFFLFQLFPSVTSSLPCQHSLDHHLLACFSHWRR